VRAARGDGELAHARRLGWLLSRTRYAEKANLLAQWLERQPRRQPTRLDPSRPVRGSVHDRRWSLWVNTEVEGDLG
jgi:hypothetical protein